MTKGRKTTQEERAEIVAFCIEHNYASITSPPPRDETSPPAAQQGEMKEFIQLTFSFCFLVSLLDRGAH